MSLTGAIKKLLVLSHRYIGIPLSFMFVVWFVSAFFMIYTGGMPRITPAMRIDGMPAVEFSQVRLSPLQAAEIAGEDWREVSLRSILGRTVYQFGLAGEYPVFVAADNGEQLTALDAAQSARLAADFLGLDAGQFTLLGELDQPDQWTLSSQQLMPLQHFMVDDPLGTEVYVSPDNMQVAVYTTRRSRMLAWLGTIPHWLYFSALRNNQPLWYDTVVLLSYSGCLMAFLGMCLSVTQLRKTRPFYLRLAIPYRGMMRWHYLLGALFGLFALTWVFSGLVSMEPWDWTNARGARLSSASYDDDSLPLDRFANWPQRSAAALARHPVKEVRFRSVGTHQFLQAAYAQNEAGGSKRDRLHQPYNINGQLSAHTSIIAVDTGRELSAFALDYLVQELDERAVDAEVAGFELLQGYDDYYYSRQQQLPLPVLRIRLDDPARTWVYVDPQTAEVLSLIHKYSRLERWLYSGLHSLDFAFWYHRRPLWDIAVLTLLAGGLGISLLGLVLGIRRLRRDLQVLFARIRRFSKGGNSHVT